MRAQVNPLGGDPADIAAGRDLFRQKCETCHTHDDSGKTEIGSGEYPRLPPLRSMDILAMPNGEVFYRIRNGIRKHRGGPIVRKSENPERPQCLPYGQIYDVDSRRP